MAELESVEKSEDKNWRAVRLAIGGHARLYGEKQGRVDGGKSAVGHAVGVSGHR